MEEAIALYKELEKYRNKDFPYNCNGEDGRGYFSRMPDSPLKNIALRILYISPHSETCKRVFSRMAYLKNKQQNRMHPDTLVGLTKIKLDVEQSTRKAVEGRKSQTEDIDYENKDETVLYKDLVDDEGEDEEEEMDSVDKVDCLEKIFDLQLKKYKVILNTVPQTVSVGKTFTLADVKKML